MRGFSKTKFTTIFVVQKCRQPKNPAQLEQTVAKGAHFQALEGKELGGHVSDIWKQEDTFRIFVIFTRQMTGAVQKRNGFSGSDKAVFVACNKTLSDLKEREKKRESLKNIWQEQVPLSSSPAKPPTVGERAGRAPPGSAHSYGRDSLCLWCRRNFTGSCLNTQISCKQPWRQAACKCASERRLPGPAGKHGGPGVSG